MNKTILNPQPTENAPVVVDNYPYGRHRTLMRYWVESVKKKGDRFVSQTLNPSTKQWNKPKKATYNAVNVVYRDESNGHISYFALCRTTEVKSYKKFIDFIGDLELNELQKEELKVLRAYIKTYEGVTFSCREVSSEETEEERKAHEEKQNEIQKTINKAVSFTYHNDLEVLQWIQ